VIHPIAALLDRLRREAQAPKRGAGRVPIMVAWGVGVDSTALIVEMVEAGLPIDQVLTADVGDERPETYAFRALFMQWLADRNVPVEVVRYEPKNFKHYPPYRSLSENCLTNGTLPSISFGFSSCSQKWKIEPQNRWTEAWAPAQRIWSRGGRVIKLIGYDCSPADAKRYAHREGYVDDRYVYGYPPREMGWLRPDCQARIARAGLPVPPKSSCFMCGAMQPEEVDELPPGLLRRIVLMEARAAPRLQKIEGLWRNGVKGTRGGKAKPGRMTDYIRAKGLLPADEIDAIRELAPAALLHWQAAQGSLPVEHRPDLARWLGLFDAAAAGRFDAPGVMRLYGAAERLAAA
jgi:hypothetical protein